MKGRSMRAFALCCIVMLFCASAAWAVEPCLENDCEVIPGACTDQDCLTPCYEPCMSSPCCEPAPCSPPCEPQACGSAPARIKCGLECEPCEEGFTHIPLPDQRYTSIDPACCPGDEYRLLCLVCWDKEYSTCCCRGEFTLLCQPRCACPEYPRCTQDICTTRCSD
jgi:hypothetical protein